MTDTPLIVGLGEALYDLLPVGPVLGGAPLNAAVQAHQIGRFLGGYAVMASRIGNDELGQAMVDTLQARGMDTTPLQRDPEAPTGTVKVTLRDTEPEYEIIEDVAWDRLDWDDTLERLAKRCDAVCFGTLGQRLQPARATVQRFVETAGQAARLFDVNLRQHYFSGDVLAAGFTAASIVKMNEEELPVVAPLLDATGDESAIAQLINQFELELFVLTRGRHGTKLFTRSETVEGRVARFKLEENADSVGAGDACSAAVLHGTVRGWPLQQTADMANQLGAYVASRSGATPELPEGLLGD
ncbi:MAG TPA: carbohydrate kinase [Verrucomicrobiales bacterium]|nr:carbohydrate kinase [Verrucomicrobiales bacterium]|tara:strand:- start:1853 stop:2749 length:897 start_codon:yes stop_codon:yes gene_type:complete